MAAKRKASALNTAVDDEPVDPSDELAFYCLGGGNEVGRSCHIIQYKGKTVMVCGNEPSRSSGLRKTDWLAQLDSGMHPAKEGFSSLPFFDEFDLSTVDILLISQYVEYTLPLPKTLAHRYTGLSRGATRAARSPLSLVEEYYTSVIQALCLCMYIRNAIIDCSRVILFPVLYLYCCMRTMSQRTQL